MKKIIQLFTSFLWLFPISVFATSQSNKSSGTFAPILFKHAEAIRGRGKVVESWFRQSMIKTLFPLELMQLVERYVPIDKTDCIFLLNDEIINVNNQIMKINISNKFLKLPAINKVNDGHNLDKFRTCLIELNQISRTVIYFIGIPESSDMGEDIWDCILDSINKKTLCFNKKTYLMEHAEKVRE